MGKKIEFGPGDAGRIAREIMTTNPLCEECGGKADHTLDVDNLGDLSQFSICRQCDPIVREKIRIELKAQGRRPSFGINGKGRA